MSQYTPSPPVTYAQAVKLKLAGFDVPVRLFYALPPITHFPRLVGGGLSNHNSSDSKISAPSQNEVSDWLRQVKGIYCAAHSKSVGGDWIPWAAPIAKNIYLSNDEDSVMDYNQALSTAIDDALNYLP